MTQYQHTTNQSIHFDGFGLHTGLKISMDIEPAPENFGIQIMRTDLEGTPTFPAVADYVSATERGTVLENGKWKVSTVEHLLSALHALCVDNVLVKVDAPEVPILDGSARYYVEAIKQVGLKQQHAERQVFVVRKKIEYITEKGNHLILMPDDHFSVDVLVGYDSPILGNQYAQLEKLEDYPTEVASARTFVFVREIEPLLDAGLIKGGNLDNALVIYERQVSQEKLDKLADLCHVEHQPADRLGYLSDLKYPNEPSRHKLLDVLGDMMLVGMPIQGKLIAKYPGHGVNTAFAKIIRKEMKKTNVLPPIYDPEKKPILDINDIKDRLPHRYPMQLVDKIIQQTKNTIVGIKNITNNEPYFQGHFPDEPIVPGVIVIEAMAQVGGLLVLNEKGSNDTYGTYLMKLDKVKFRQKIVPGDTLIMRMELIEPVRRGIVVMRGHCFVGERLVAEAEMVAQIIKHK